MFGLKRTDSIHKVTLADGTEWCGRFNQRFSQEGDEPFAYWHAEISSPSTGEIELIVSARLINKIEFIGRFDFVKGKGDGHFYFDAESADPGVFEYRLRPISDNWFAPLEPEAVDDPEKV